MRICGIYKNTRFFWSSLSSRTFLSLCKDASCHLCRLNAARLQFIYCFFTTRTRALGQHPLSDRIRSHASMIILKKKRSRTCHCFKSFIKKTLATMMLFVMGCGSKWISPCMLQRQTLPLTRVWIFALGKLEKKKCTVTVQHVYLYISHFLFRLNVFCCFPNVAHIFWQRYYFSVFALFMIFTLIHSPKLSYAPSYFFFFLFLYFT